MQTHGFQIAFQLEDVIDSLGERVVGQGVVLLLDLFFQDDLDHVAAFGHHHQLFARILERGDFQAIELEREGVDVRVFVVVFEVQVPLRDKPRRRNLRNEARISPSQ